MHKLLPVLPFFLLLAACGGESAPVNTPDSATETGAAVTEVAPAATAAGFSYPESATVDQVDDYHGTAVADPYRWLEDDVRVSTNVADWVAAQNAVTFDYLGSIEERPVIEERLTKLWNYEKFGIPGKAGGQYFFSRNDGLQNQNVIYRQASLDAEPVMVVDPNTWSEDGTVALAGFEVSPDGRYAALAVQDGGSDWRTVQVLDIESGETLDDRVEWMKFSPMSWAADSSGFYYSRYPEPGEGDEFQSLNHNQQVFFHAVGTSQDEDRLVMATPDNPDWGFAPQVTDDGAYLVITVWKGTDDRYQVA